MKLIRNKIRVSNESQILSIDNCNSGQEKWIWVGGGSRSICGLFKAEHTQKSTMPNSQIINLQKTTKLDVGVHRSFVKGLASAISETKRRVFTIAFIDDARMKQLNEMFRGKKTTTDVLSFHHEPDEFDPDKDNLGDIVISVEQAQRQAEENGLTLEGEIKQLILHGVLHLCGYDHETDDGEMNRRELTLRKKLGI